MRIFEMLLYRIAKYCYRPPEEKSLDTKENYEKYRSGSSSNLVNKAKEFGIDIKDKKVLDFGCASGVTSQEYYLLGAKNVIGADIDKDEIERAKIINKIPNVEFILSDRTSIPLPENCIDIIFCNSVFEHVSHPKEIINEFYRILRPNGKVFIGTWGWYHPEAAHLWGICNVPWVQVFFSEKTIANVCRRIYRSKWYKPCFWDFDHNGNRISKFIDSSAFNLVNKFLIKDYEKIFKKSSFSYKIIPRRFSSRFAKWTGVFLNVPIVKEFITSYIYVLLLKK